MKKARPAGPALGTPEQEFGVDQRSVGCGRLFYPELPLLPATPNELGGSGLTGEQGRLEAIRDHKWGHTCGGADQGVTGVLHPW